jgi:hypothetical protein
LVPWLEAQAAPDTVIVAAKAVAADHDALAITLRYAQGYDPDRSARRSRPPCSTRHGAPRGQAPADRRLALFRSVVVERIHRVAGVAAIESILLDGDPLPAGVPAGQGGWFDLEAQSTVS